jgi:hypothetical protein
VQLDLYTQIILSVLSVYQSANKAYVTMIHGGNLNLSNPVLLNNVRTEVSLFFLQCDRNILY